MELVFDLIIYFYLATVGIYLFHSLHFWNQTRKHRVLLVVFILLACSWVVVFYGSFIEPRMIVVVPQELTLSDTPTQTLRAAVFSDLHVGPFKKQDWAQRVVDQVMALQPDIIFIAGDFVVSSAQDVRYLEPLKQLSAPYGVYAVTGNHEYHAEASVEVIQILQEAGIKVIQNEVLNLEVNSKKLRLAGVSDIWFGGDLNKTMENVLNEETVLLLVHNPDVMLMDASRKVDAVLAAHTHGGQIRLPLIGPVAHIPTQLGQKYDKGLFQFDQTQLFITSGVGESGTRARLFNPPEIVLMNIHF